MVNVIKVHYCCCHYYPQELFYVMGKDSTSEGSHVPKGLDNVVGRLFQGFCVCLFSLRGGLLEYASVSPGCYNNTQTAWLKQQTLFLAVLKALKSKI